MKIFLFIYFLFFIIVSPALANDIDEGNQKRLKTLFNELLVCEQKITICNYPNKELEVLLLMGGGLSLIEFADDKKRILYNMLQEYLIYKNLGRDSKKIAAMFAKLMDQKDFSGRYAGYPFGSFSACFIKLDNYSSNFQEIRKTEFFFKCMEPNK